DVDAVALGTLAFVEFIGAEREREILLVFSGGAPLLGGGGSAGLLELARFPSGPSGGEVGRVVYSRRGAEQVRGGDDALPPLPGQVAVLLGAVQVAFDGLEAHSGLVSVEGSAHRVPLLADIVETEAEMFSRLLAGGQGASQLFLAGLQQGEMAALEARSRRLLKVG